jgi:predicted pyridoxine 5'-phosphate oxidase superfamily flavin-nucleotide-binding protein
VRRFNLIKYKNLIEGKILYLATADRRASPNLICVEGNKIIDNKILITDNCFKKTFQNLRHNKKVAFIATRSKRYLQFKGIAGYYNMGKYFNLVKKLPHNKDFHPKGALLIKIKEIYDLDGGQKIY